MLSNLPHIRIYTARNKFRVEIMTSLSVVFITIFIRNFSQRLPWQQQFGGKNIFLYTGYIQLGKKIQRVEIMTSPSVDFFTIFNHNFSQRLPWQRQFGGKNTFFLWQRFKHLYLRNDMKYLGAFNRKPVLSYSGSFLATLVYKFTIYLERMVNFGIKTSVSKCRF